MAKTNKILTIISVVLIVIIIGLLVYFMNRKPTMYNITFNSEGGTEVLEQTVEKNSKVLRPADPTKDGYVFVDWEYNGQPFDFNTSITSDITLIAKWKEVKKNTDLVTVKFDTDGGSIISRQIIEKGSKLEIPSIPTKEGYKFVEWQLDNKKFDFDTQINENITLKAKWEKTNEASSSKPSSSSQKPSSNSQKPSSNSQKPSSSSQKPSSSSQKPSSSSPSSSTKKTYTVTFNSNGGSSVGTQTIEEGGKATKPADPTRSGFTFAGWQLNGSAYNFNNAVTGNIILTAAWTQNQPKSYTIRITPVDAYTPQVRLTVYENGTSISVSEVRFTDGVRLCGANLTADKSEVEGETSFIVILNNGSSVTANVIS